MSMIAQMRAAPYRRGLDFTTYNAYSIIGDEERMKKIARTRTRLKMPITVCPCDAKATDRGCIGCKCLKEIIENGKCLCGCYFRLSLTPKEVKVILQHYGYTFENFLDYVENSHSYVCNKIYLPDGSILYSQDAVISFLHSNTVGIRHKVNYLDYLEGEKTLALLAKKLLVTEDTISLL